MVGSMASSPRYATPHDEDDVNPEDIACPWCLAAPQHRCVGANGKPLAGARNHHVRVLASILPKSTAATARLTDLLKQQEQREATRVANEAAAVARVDDED